MELPIFSMEGKKVGTIALPEAIFGVQWRSDLVHQVTTAMQANLRQNRAHTKDRSEVSGGGKKPWKQKGTGQARHGSTRSPIWRHGGVTFGPRSERDYSEKINRKMRIGALVSVLSRKVKDGEVILVDKFTFAAPKTAIAKGALAALAKSAGADMLTTKKKKKKKKKAARAPHARTTKLSGGIAHEIIHAPWFSEKALIATEKGVYTFEVPSHATKAEIASAINEIYKVAPRKIRM